MQEQRNTHTCKNCGNEFTGKYCNNCGQKLFTRHDKSIPHFFEDAFHFITHFEGTFFNTLRAMFTRPGKLSYDFCEGRRKRYFRPLSFFMLLVVLYLLFPRFTGLNMPLKLYLNEKTYARSMVQKKSGVDMDSIGVQIRRALNERTFSGDQERYAFAMRYSDSLFNQYPALKRLEASYNKKSETTSKVLLLILIPCMALAFFLLSFYRRRMMYDHLVLATEFNAFFVLSAFLLLPVLTILLYKLFPAFSIRYLTDNNLGYIIYTVAGIYASMAFRYFYKDPWYLSVPKALAAIYLHTKIVHIIYKFVLFVVTLKLS
jgi:hypothetical protein